MLKRAILLLLLLTVPILCADLQLERQERNDVWVHGVLKIDDLTIATIENTKTLIPPGKHRVILSYSPRFKKITPEILVENREGIRIHAVAVGKKFALEGCVGVSYTDYAKLMTKLGKRNTITITAVQHPPQKLTYLKILLAKLIALKVYLYRYAKMLHLSY